MDPNHQETIDADGDTVLAYTLPDTGDTVTHGGQTYKVQAVHMRKHDMTDRLGRDRRVIAYEFTAVGGDDDFSAEGANLIDGIAPLI